MTVDVDKKFARIFRELESFGLLLVSGSEIPDVRKMVSTEVARGSWWGDTAAHTIFAINERLESHPDVLLTKLMAGKSTFVHRSLWPRFFAIATAREEWQMRKLSPEARKLLRKLDQQQSLATSKLSSAYGSKPGETARELELRLLVHTTQVHTPSGAHSKILQTWHSWAGSVNFKPRDMRVESAKAFFERRVAEFNPDNAKSLPWRKLTR